MARRKINMETRNLKIADILRKLDLMLVAYKAEPMTVKRLTDLKAWIIEKASSGVNAGGIGG